MQESAQRDAKDDINGDWEEAFYDSTIVKTGRVQRLVAGRHV